MLTTEARKNKSGTLTGSAFSYTNRAMRNTISQNAPLIRRNIIQNGKNMSFKSQRPLPRRPLPQTKLWKIRPQLRKHLKSQLLQLTDPFHYHNKTRLSQRGSLCFCFIFLKATLRFSSAFRQGFPANPGTCGTSLLRRTCTCPRYRCNRRWTRRRRARSRRNRCSRAA